MIKKKPSKIKTPRKKSINALKKECWMWMSRYIRLRDNFTCFTCGKVMLDNPQSAQAGHYIPQSKGNTLRFYERNVHCQCINCNMYQSGNLVQYALRLEEKYGEGILQELD